MSAHLGNLNAPCKPELRETLDIDPKASDVSASEAEGLRTPDVRKTWPRGCIEREFAELLDAYWDKLPERMPSLLVARGHCCHCSKIPVMGSPQSGRSVSKGVEEVNCGRQSQG
ncbi:unnamed protein product [Durusdinium trenchii]|uniref:Uncharacterized protein n=1 Tax=Durusdinium trenchii TaxID=1381693 RepID=A0ABP0RGB5_9DINO